MDVAIIRSKDALRQLYGEPGDLPKRKILNRLDDHCRAFIASSPLLILATHDGQGRCDASPRGDQPGFVEVLDDHHILLPDKPGNKRIDSLMNILEAPSVGMLFLIPSVHETLRVNGIARITCDKNLLAKHEERKQVPKTGLLIEVEEAFLHCSRSLQSARIWKPESWPGGKVLAPASRIWADHIALSTAADEGAGR